MRIAVNTFDGQRGLRADPLLSGIGILNRTENRSDPLSSRTRP